MPAIPKSLPVPPLSAASAAAAAANGQTRRAAKVAVNGNGNGNAVAGPSTLKRKDKQPTTAVNGNTSAASDTGAQQPAKKLRTNKSPTAASQNNTDDAMSVTSNRSNDDAAARKSRKGKGRAVDDDGDSEMAHPERQSQVTAAAPITDEAQAANSPSSVAAEPASTKSTLAKAIAAAATVTSKAIPHPFAKKDVPPSARRSTSPVFATRKPSATRDGAGNATKSRPRSTSPATMFRTNSSSHSSSKSATTPTLDATKASSLLSAKPEGALSEIPKPNPAHILQKDSAIALKGHTAPVQPCAWNPNVAELLATGSSDSTLRIWDISSAKQGEVVEPSHTCKHASGQRRSDVTAIAWNVSRCFTNHKSDY